MRGLEVGGAPELDQVGLAPAPATLQAVCAHMSTRGGDHVTEPPSDVCYLHHNNYRGLRTLVAAADARHGRLEDLKVPREEERGEGAVARHAVAARRQREHALVVVHQDVARCG